MSCFLYILYSESLDRFYIGISHDPETRLQYHNSFPKGWTRRGRPWTMKFTKGFSDKAEAQDWEQWIKNQKKRSIILKVINNEFDWDKF